MDEDENSIEGYGMKIFPNWEGLGPMGPPRPNTEGQLTLALLEELAAVLQRHGYPPLRGYALAELTASLYRLARMHWPAPCRGPQRVGPRWEPRTYRRYRGVRRKET